MRYVYKNKEYSPVAPPALAGSSNTPALSSLFPAETNQKALAVRIINLNLYQYAVSNGIQYLLG